MNSIEKKQSLNELSSALNKRGFEAIVCKDSKQACDAIDRIIESNSSVGLGGSMTLQAIELRELLNRKNCILNDHRGTQGEERDLIMARQKHSDYFITSANAITLEGEIVNMDGVGNRVSASIHGPGHVIFVAGYNKICKDLTAAIERLRSTASPMNNKRLETGNPCQKTGRCMNCNYPGSICNAMVVHFHPCIGVKTSVVLIDEELGY